jgi:hypothetical protein
MTSQPDISTLTITNPDHTSDQNWAEVATEAWIATHGGRDVTETHMTSTDEGDGCYAGHVDINGVVHRLHLNQQSNTLIGTPIATTPAQTAAATRPADTTWFDIDVWTDITDEHKPCDLHGTPTDGSGRHPCDNLAERRYGTINACGRHLERAWHAAVDQTVYAQTYDTDQTYSGAPDECSVHWPTKWVDCTDCNPKTPQPIDPADQAVTTIEDTIVRIVAELDQLTELVPTATASRLWVADPGYIIALLSEARATLNTIYTHEV